ncbi:hypothetical protein AVEN_140576-1 [Araneus ventricosus]|uniref:Tc1-like transposase DDE domain-containing protein n=1 Tax=Araneus ventricosus TaxID=182803 RepID=A0A4Y2KVK8_ARAVE|nr:hypothetical protein AVEN_140576-1 [Araneus ventricosus]
MALKVFHYGCPLLRPSSAAGLFCPTRTRLFRDYCDFMQDGAPPHIAQQVQELFRSHFGDDRVISSSFPTVWPSRSPDLDPCDFWLWRFLKDHAYGRNTWTLPELKASLTRYVSPIDRETLRTTIEHAIERFENVLEADGMHIEHML